ncbi:hypothetical protein ABC345_09035 [Shouchella sp. 1P09AA]|uniref:hypothetical protein n=1 Tax=unclassified Shouchella TaxID=2893065 RepID=UPI0039A09867
MKKWSMFSLVLLTTILLSACNNGGNEPAEEGESGQTSDETSSENHDSNEASIDGVKDSWTEVPLVLEEIEDSITRVELTNDRGGSRVILYYTNEEGPQYKSVLVKDEERLKIISINENGEGEIFNEIVEDRL